MSMCVCCACGCVGVFARVSAMLDSVLFMMSKERFESTIPTTGANSTLSQIMVTGVDISKSATLRCFTSAVMSEANLMILTGRPSTSRIGL